MRMVIIVVMINNLLLDDDQMMLLIVMMRRITWRIEDGDYFGHDDTPIIFALNKIKIKQKYYLVLMASTSNQLID